MKKLWVNLLAVLLFAALAMTCASAEADEEIIPGDGLEVEVQVEAADDGIIFEDDLSMEVPELPVLGENDGIALDLTLEDVEAVTVSPDNAVESNDDAGDFEIINGILVKYNGEGGDVVIPDGVTAIGEGAFSNCSDLTSVSIPNSVTSIGEEAFYECTYLTIVTIPKSITTIGRSVFSGCSSLTNVSIPNSVTSIGINMFSRCSSLPSISIPNSVTSIGDWAFYGCSSLTNVTIPNSVTSIGNCAFNGCSSLTNVTIPNSVTSIGTDAFSGCSSFTSFTIPNRVTSVQSHTLSDCTRLTTIIIPDSVTCINDHAFYNCSSLISFTIPGSVSSIGDSAFSCCSSLTDITIPDSVVDAGCYVFSDCISLTSITIGRGLTCIPFNTFSGCNNLENIVLPANIDSIGEKAFNKCYSLMDVTLLNGTISIENNAFSQCPTSMVFHTPCDSAATKWVEEKGYKVIKSDHTPVTDPAVAPTCTETGLTEGSHCSVCGETLEAQQTVPVLGHTPVTDPAVAPTCAEAGKTEGSHCSVCGKVLVKQKKIPKLISLKKCKITGIKNAVFTGKAIKPVPVVKYKGKELVKGVDYTVKYTANKAVGAATVTVTGIGRYGESVSKTFKINPKAVALSKLTAGKRQLTVTWKKGVVNTWYEIQYSLKKNFAGAKTIAIKKAATVKTVLKKLTTGKTYYVRIRAYKTVNGKKYFSAWSKAKSAKVK